MVRPPSFVTGNSFVPFFIYDEERTSCLLITVFRSVLKLSLANGLVVNSCITKVTYFCIVQYVKSNLKQYCLAMVSAVNRHVIEYGAKSREVSTFDVPIRLLANFTTLYKGSRLPSSTKLSENTKK